MATIHFTKMHGLGNDFVVIDCVQQAISADDKAQLLQPAFIQKLAYRNFGIGFDQMLLVENAVSANADFRYRIFNADGSEVEHCGNGARCFARFVREQGLTDKDEIVVDIHHGQMVLHVLDELIQVDMGQPRFTAESLPVDLSHATSYSTSSDSTNSQHTSAHSQSEHNSSALNLVLTLDGKSQAMTCISMGNPHAVILCEGMSEPDFATQNIAPLAQAIQQHAAFPQGVNVGFLRTISREEAQLRVYERGSGETLACGTGACAAVVAGQSLGLLNDSVTMHLTGGDLRIDYSLKANPLPSDHLKTDNNSATSITMTGPAVSVFSGIFTL